MDTIELVPGVVFERLSPRNSPASSVLSVSMIQFKSYYNVNKVDASVHIKYLLTWQPINSHPFLVAG